MDDLTIQSYETFKRLVLRVLEDKKSVTLGNVEFWVDVDGPWAGQLSYLCPTPRWKGVAEALTEALSGVSDGAYEDR